MFLSLFAYLFGFIGVALVNTQLQVRKYVCFSKTEEHMHLKRRQAISSSPCRTRVQLQDPGNWQKRNLNSLGRENGSGVKARIFTSKLIIECYGWKWPFGLYLSYKRRNSPKKGQDLPTSWPVGDEVTAGVQSRGPTVQSKLWFHAVSNPILPGQGLRARKVRVRGSEPMFHPAEGLLGGAPGCSFAAKLWGRKSCRGHLGKVVQWKNNSSCLFKILA